MLKSVIVQWTVGDYIGKLEISIPHGSGDNGYYLSRTEIRNGVEGWYHNGQLVKVYPGEWRLYLNNHDITGDDFYIILDILDIQQF